MVASASDARESLNRWQVAAKGSSGAPSSEPVTLNHAPELLNDRSLSAKDAPEDAADRRLSDARPL
jgi:hypothetical protein